MATPIGNLEDITLRALRLLGECDLVFAEDTRRTRILLDRHGIEARLVSLNAHNERSRIAQALELLDRDGSLVILSDAGTPLVSDPGERLVEAAIDAGHRVEPIPGASAVLSALVVSGLRATPFTFLGFLPRRSAARRALLEVHRARSETLVLFESPHRVADTLADLAEVLGPRRACVARELTKLHEEVVRGDLEALRERFSGPVKGEFTLVVEGCDEGVAERARAVQREAVVEDVDEEIRRLVASGRRPREIAATLAPRTGLPKRELYARAVALREES